jgi:amino acid transporter
MYAYAFGSFASGLAIVPDSIAGFPSRPAISMLAVGSFVGLNLLGAKSTGMAENIMVAAKILVLLVLGGGGIIYGVRQDRLVLGLSELASFAPVMAAAVSFVAFQGWQLLYYDQESIRDPISTIRKAVYIAIPSAVVIYVIVAVTTLSLAPPEVIQSEPERALAVAADPFIPYGSVIISIAALFSTGSAINATLFSCGYFAKSMLSSDLLPDRVGDSSRKGLPRRTVIGLGIVTAGFAAWGTLGAITSFASLAFIVVFGGTCALAFLQRDSARAAIFPAIGAVGATLFFGLMFYHLYSAERDTFFSVIGITVVALGLELFYFERVDR